MTVPEDQERPQLDPRHVARLQVIELKKARVFYACEVVHRERGDGFATNDVMAWLADYGYGPDDELGQKRNRVSEAVSDYRKEHELADTGPGTGKTGRRILPLTPEVLDAMDEQRATGRVVPFRTPDADRTRPVSDQTPAPDGPDASAGHRTADRTGTPDGPDTAGQATPDASGQEASARTPAESLPAPADTPRPVADWTPDRTRPVPSGPVKRPDTVQLMLRFGWRPMAGAALQVVGLLAVLAAGLVELARRTFGWTPFPADWRIVAAGGGLGLVLAVVGVVLVQRAPKRPVRRVLLTAPAKAWYAAFGLALIASADASFRMWHEVVGLTLVESSLVFTLLEAMILASSLSMRANLISEGKPGMARTVLWGLSGFAVIAAFATTTSVGAGAWRAVFGPLGATLCLHMAMDVEVRAEGARESINRLGQALRSLGQHVLSYVGAGTGDQTWIVIRHQRAVARAARLGSVASPGKLTVWRLRRARRACGAGVTQAATADLMTALAAERATHALFTLPTVSPWDGAEIQAPAVIATHQKQAREANKQAARRPQTSHPDRTDRTR